MAERIIRQLIDDLDQTEIPDGKGGSVEFALRGTAYTIDLSDANIAKLDKAFAPFIAAAITAAAGENAPAAPRSPSTRTRKKRPARGSTKRARTTSTETVRAWAAENGHHVSARGRIPAAVAEAYDPAHAPTT